MALVLVVDDEPLIRMSATAMVAQLGYDVLETDSADEAVRILESRDDIRIVFSDVQMPGTMDGLRLLKVIRDRWPPICLILTSGKPWPKVRFCRLAPFSSPSLTTSKPWRTRSPGRPLRRKSSLREPSRKGRALPLKLRYERSSSQSSSFGPLHHRGT